MSKVVFYCLREKKYFIEKVVGKEICCIYELEF